MKSLLLNIKSEVEKASLSANTLSLDKIILYEEKYDFIVPQGQKENLKLNFHSRTVKTKKNKSKALLKRLSLHQDEILRFMNDFDIPFGNNQYSAGIRKAKIAAILNCIALVSGTIVVKQKSTDLKKSV